MRHFIKKIIAFTSLVFLLTSLLFSQASNFPYSFYEKSVPYNFEYAHYYSSVDTGTKDYSLRIYIYENNYFYELTYQHSPSKDEIKKVLSNCVNSVKELDSKLDKNKRMNTKQTYIFKDADGNIICSATYKD